MRPTYEGFTNSLSQLLTDLISSQGIETIPVEGRTKALNSLDHKIRREEKSGKYSQLDDITDLCGIRLIAYLKEDCRKISDIIESNFIIDESNSIVKGGEDDEDKFGYNSRHYVVSLNAARTNLPEFKRFRGLKAEIQIRTVLQHAWAAIDWRFRYKREKEAPKELRRRLYRISALLDAADDEFSYVSEKLNTIRESYAERMRRGDLNIPVNFESLSRYFETSTTIGKIVEEAEKAGINIAPETFEGFSRLQRVSEKDGLAQISDLDSKLRKLLPDANTISSSFVEIVKEQPPVGSVPRQTKCAVARMLLTANRSKKQDIDELLDLYDTPSPWPPIYFELSKRYHSKKNVKPL